MRRDVVFAVLTIPAAAWAGVVVWAQSMAAGWTPAAGELGLPIRVALASSAWLTRYLPFALVPGMLAWPLIVLGIAAITRSFSSLNTSTRHDVMVWWCISGAAFAAMLVTAGIFFLRSPSAELPVAAMACLGWIGVVAFWVSLAAAYAVQQKRYLAHESEWHPGKLLAALAILNCGGLFALPLLVAIAFRKREVSQ